jgi:spore maturation protein A
MLNYLWAFMMIIGILWGAVNGTMDQVTQGALNSAKEAVELCVTMLGVMSLWTGILEIGQSAGLMGQIAGKMRPVLRFLFPGLPKDHPASLAIATNMIANMLGLGWAATPAGLKAMESLEELEEERRKAETEKKGYKSRKGRLRPAAPKGTASNEMCTFLILNISSLQLIPVNMIAYRSQYGSVNPAAIVGPAIVATAVSTLTAMIYCKIMDRKQ